MQDVYICKILMDKQLQITGLLPPEDMSLFNFAKVTIDKKGVKSWCDPSSAFPDYKIPEGTRWAYVVHIVEQTNDVENPLNVGQRVGNLHIELSEAMEIARWVRGQGCFPCIVSALIVDGREKLN